MFNSNITSKKGLSPVVASVLMILLVIFLAIIIFLWARGFLNERIEKFGEPIEDICKNINFDIEVVDISDYYYLEIINRGNIGINYFDFKIYAKGNSETIRINTGVPASKSIATNILLTNILDDPIEKIEVFPILKGDMVGKSKLGIYTCNDKSIYLDRVV